MPRRQRRHLVTRAGSQQKCQDGRGSAKVALGSGGRWHCDDSAIAGACTDYAFWLIAGQRNGDIAISLVVPRLRQSRGASGRVWRDVDGRRTHIALGMIRRLNGSRHALNLAL